MQDKTKGRIIFFLKEREYIYYIILYKTYVSDLFLLLLISMIVVEGKK